MSIEELVKWVIDTDRRLLAMKVFDEYPVKKASEVAVLTGRSVQNISRALNELEEKGLVESLKLGKRSWRKYILTEVGEEVLVELEKKNLLQ